MNWAKEGWRRPPVSRAVDQIHATFQRLQPCYQSRRNWYADETGSEKSEMVASKSKILILRFLDMLAPKFVVFCGLGTRLE